MQMLQEMSLHVSQLTVFQRTPNLCLSMRQWTLSYEEQIDERPDLSHIFAHHLTANSGYADDLSTVVFLMIPLSNGKSVSRFFGQRIVSSSGLQNIEIFY